MAIKKLIEVALPLDKINAECAREKSIRHGHPSTLHLWWARRPLAAARAVIWSSLVDDPSSHPEKFPTEEDQNKERKRLFDILEKLVVWENDNDPNVLEAAKAEIMKSTNGNPPALLDPFAGGGAIPLEAQRLGLEAHAHDLNPVAVMINKAMIEIPPKFAGQAPVNPDAQSSLTTKNCWSGTAGLAEDVRYYGEWMKKEAFKRIGHLYPKVKVPAEQGGGEATVIAWMWARTVKCPNPACGCQMPLISSFVLSKKKGKEAWLDLSIQDDEIIFHVKNGKYSKELENGTKHVNTQGKSKKATFCCPICGCGVADGDYIDKQAGNGNMGAIPLAMVAEGKHGRLYLDADNVLNASLINEVDNYYYAHDIESSVSHAPCRGTFASNAQGRYYCFREFKDYFTRRQLIALTTFSELIIEAQKQAETDAISAGVSNDHLPICDGGTGARAYGDAIGVYLSFAVDRLADRCSSLCGWDNGYVKIRNTFGRQAISMTWDYVEGNPFSESTGCFISAVEWIYKCIMELPGSLPGTVRQFDAQSDSGLRDIMVSTDPPYYDNIEYADLSDFFYVWLRQSLGAIYPKLFRTMLVPKVEELVATPYRFEGSKQKAKDFFEKGMLHTCEQIFHCVRDDVPVTIYFAYKQSETDSKKNKTSSSGWETMLKAIIQAGFTITGTWPMRTEMANRTIASGTNALASSIVLVCRKRAENALQTTRRNLVNVLRRELRPALKKLQESNIAPVDLAQSAIGPGMGVFSQYRRVLEADGTEMSVRSALQIINEEIDLYFNEQVGSMDMASRFCVDLYTQSAYNDIQYGVAEVLANAKGASIPLMVDQGVLYAKAGNVHLVERNELPVKVSSREGNIWLLTQQLTRAMAKGGIEACAEIVFSMYGSNTENAKDLAYRLYTIAERKGWTDEAYAYNTLVVAWPDIQNRAAEMKADVPEQLNLFTETD